VLHEKSTGFALRPFDGRQILPGLKCCLARRPAPGAATFQPERFSRFAGPVTGLPADPFP